MRRRYDLLCWCSLCWCSLLTIFLSPARAVVFYDDGATHEDAPYLYQAVRDGLIKVSVSGLGGSTGDVLKVTMQRLVERDLTITVAVGTTFVSNSRQTQNITAYYLSGESTGGNKYRPCDIIMLNDDTPHTYIVNGFCMDFHRHNPTPADDFKVAEPHPGIVQLVTNALARMDPPRVMQLAIWMGRDTVRDAEMRQRFNASDEELQAAHELIATITKHR